MDSRQNPFQGAIRNYQRNPWFNGPTPQAFLVKEQARQDIRNVLERTFNYKTPFWQGISPQGSIAGLHPGSLTAASVIRSMTPFGSSFDVKKHLAANSPSRQLALSNLNTIGSALKDPNLNLINFDIETSGLHAPLESPIKGSTGVMSEFAIKSSTKTTHGFTKYASVTEYSKAMLSGGSFSPQFQQAAKRYIDYQGPSFSAEGVVQELGSHIQPGKRNVIAAHNLGGMDWKYLSAHYALEKGYVTQEQLSTYRGLGQNAHAAQYFHNVIRKGWEDSSNAILKSLREKDSNLQLLDTFGAMTEKKGIWPRPEMLGGEKGLIGNLLEGKLPGVASHWTSEFEKLGYPIEKAVEQASFAARKGTSLEGLIRLTGGAFTGEAHHPVSDVTNQGAWLDKELNNILSTPEDQLYRKYFANQETEVLDVLASKSSSTGQKRLAGIMKAGLPTSFESTPSQFEQLGMDLWSGFKKAPISARIGIGIGAGLGLLVIGRGLFAHDRKEVFSRNRRISASDDDYNTISGMPHGGYAQQVRHQMTPFGSGFQTGNLLKSAWKFTLGSHTGKIGGLGVLAAIGAMAMGHADIGFSVMGGMAAGSSLGHFKGRSTAGLLVGGVAGAGLGYLGSQFGPMGVFTAAALMSVGASAQMAGALKGGQIYEDTLLATRELIKQMPKKITLPSGSVINLRQQSVKTLQKFKKSLGIDINSPRGLYKDVSEMMGMADQVMNEPDLLREINESGWVTRSVFGSFNKTNKFILNNKFITKQLDATFGSPALARVADLKGSLKKASWSELGGAIREDFVESLPLATTLAGISAISSISEKKEPQQGMHPGDKGYATSTIRGMTAFGSGHDPFKAIGQAVEWLAKAGFTKNKAALRLQPAAMARSGIKTIYSGESHGRVVRQIKQSGLTISDFQFGFVTKDAIPMEGELARKVFFPRSVTEELYGFENSSQWELINQTYAGMSKSTQSAASSYISAYKEMQTLLNEVDTSTSITKDGLHPGGKGAATEIIRKLTDFGSGFDAAWVMAKWLQRQRLNATRGIIKKEVTQLAKPVNIIKDMTSAKSSFNIPEELATIDKIIKRGYEPPRPYAPIVRKTTTEILQERPTVGLGGVLEQQAHKHTQYPGKIPL
jgi:hypothetical protein